MTGLIWCVQIVIYPLFSEVGDSFQAYHRQYTERIGWVVAPVMTLELGCAGWWWRQEPGFCSGVGLMLAGLIWLSTVVVQMPLHNRLSQRYSEKSARRLVRTNWLRTICWSLRAVLVLAVGGV